jgi:hypothetical protein
VVLFTVFQYVCTHVQSDIVVQGVQHNAGHRVSVSLCIDTRTVRIRVSQLARSGEILQICSKSMPALLPCTQSFMSWDIIPQSPFWRFAMVCSVGRIFSNSKLSCVKPRLYKLWIWRRALSGEEPSYVKTWHYNTPDGTIDFALAQVLYVVQILQTPNSSHITEGGDDRYNALEVRLLVLQNLLAFVCRLHTLLSVQSIIIKETKTWKTFNNY